MMFMGGTESFEARYRGVSPQLLARVRQNWSAQQIDLDALWREAVAAMPGFRDPEPGVAALDSRPVDLLLLFDQGYLWVDALRREAAALAPQPAEGEASLTREQTAGLGALAARLCDDLAAVRLLALAGLATPAMQISRTVSEDVDLALAILVRRKVAAAFDACRTPEDAAAFWRSHVAGGRAFQLVARALYEHGLDRGEDSEYARWRREVLTFLGAAVHGGPGAGMGAAAQAARRAPLGSALQECLYFATVRVQELSAYAIVLGAPLRADLARLSPQSPAQAARLRFLLRGGDILIDQMRWLTEVDEPPRRDAALH